MCPSSGEITESMRHLILVTVYGRLSGMQVGIKKNPSCIPDSHPYTVTSTKFRIDTFSSPDDGYTKKLK